jgi:hypothetical protein
MLLTARTTVYITGKDGTSEMSFAAFLLAIQGGLNLAEVEVTTNPEHSRRLGRKRRAQQEVQQLMSNMTPDQAEKVVEVLRGNEELMELHDDYA